MVCRHATGGLPHRVPEVVQHGGQDALHQGTVARCVLDGGSRVVEDVGQEVQPGHLDGCVVRGQHQPVADHVHDL